MSEGFVVVIPARYGSQRFPGKPLAMLGGRPMIAHVWERARESGAAEVLIATDDRRIVAVCEEFGAQVLLTADNHVSGTDRLAEVCTQRGWADDTIVVNLQGDEPMMPPALLSQVAANLMERPEADMATLAVALDDTAPLPDPNVVKVVRREDGYAMYFSRAPIPWDRDGLLATDGLAAFPDVFLRHLGIYAYRAGFLRAYPGLPPAPLERLESLEQLRALWHGALIHVGVASQAPEAGVDTPADLERVARLLPPQA
ncbi:3-deoxy-manno-octulosonate cytidylyltransferase [Alkalilimnicola sp. S0819]|uniref:3-deoxy-manno-octulosonate cytidylyltransferase n=1 Tax=Alkalilimnicola sp. S0819 TaxID=2613922 RepID=UPI001261EC27|nr:3-deoxy-manno-octulosonate cytidylyltransferase [Alkalilimnicola sp. S0819]KAB7627628.1 3-deoxy-manno-octulosonate cytidylyltransferase [Alkalilimnicola sp. S0819]MPQ15791.1 3-deoxy-manno-octulosonate cytidylyltransferase [Alkalilimnicola sp. S0819]